MHGARGAKGLPGCDGVKVNFFLFYLKVDSVK